MKNRKYIYAVIYLLSVSLITLIAINCGKVTKTTDVKENDKKEEKRKDSLLKSTPPNTSKGAAGREIFYMKSPENNISCSDCHFDGSNRNSPLVKYFSPIDGANQRTSTYHGKFTGADVAKNAGGATICWESYLRMKTPLTEDQIKDLNTFYGAVATELSMLEVNYETIALPTRDKAKLKDSQKLVTDLKGDPAKGEQMFQNACGFCHGENSTIKKVPHILEDFDGNVKSIVYKVRLGDEAMPFFKFKFLTDQDIADISAYVLQKNGK